MKESVRCKGAQVCASISSDADSLQEIHAQIRDFTNTSTLLSFLLLPYFFSLSVHPDKHMHRYIFIEALFLFFLCSIVIAWTL